MTAGAGADSSQVSDAARAHEFRKGLHFGGDDDETPAPEAPADASDAPSATGDA